MMKSKKPKNATNRASSLLLLVNTIRTFFSPFLLSCYNICLIFSYVLEHPLYEYRRFNSIKSRYRSTFYERFDSTVARRLTLYESS